MAHPAATLNSTAASAPFEIVELDHLGRLSGCRGWLYTLVSRSGLSARGISSGCGHDGVDGCGAYGEL